jgi:hypothetical protein
MHYGPKEFSPNGKPTIKAFKGGSFGQRKGFSDLDLQKLNKYYECDRKEGFTYNLLWKLKLTFLNSNALWFVLTYFINLSF